MTFTCRLQVRYDGESRTTGLTDGPVLPGEKASSKSTGVCFSPKSQDETGWGGGDREGDGSQPVPRIATLGAMLAFAEGGFPARGSSKGQLTPSDQKEGCEATRSHFPSRPYVPAACTQLSGRACGFLFQRLRAWTSPLGANPERHQRGQLGKMAEEIPPPSTSCLGRNRVRALAPGSWPEREAVCCKVIGEIGIWDKF